MQIFGIANSWRNSTSNGTFLLFRKKRNFYFLDRSWADIVHWEVKMRWPINEASSQGSIFWRFGEGAKPNFGQKLKTFLPFQSEMTSIIIILLVTEMLRARAEKPPKIAKHREHRLPLDASCNQLQRKVDRR